MLLTAVLVTNVGHDCQCQHTCLYTRCPIKCTFVSILATLIKTYNLLAVNFTCLIFKQFHKQSPLNVSTHGTSNPPCGKSWEYFVLPVISQLIVRPLHKKNRETPSVLPWQVPDNNTVNGNCIGILMISRLFCTPEDLSDNGVSFLSVDMIPSHTTFQCKSHHWSRNRDDVL